MNPLEIITRLIEASQRTRRERALSKVEKWLAGKMRKAFQAQSRAFFDYLPVPVVQEAAGDQLPFPQWEQAFTAAVEATRELFTVPMEEAIRISIMSGANNLIAELGVDLAFTVEHPAAVEYARVHAAEQVTKINDATRRYLNTIITDGIENGQSYGQIAKTITDRYADFAVPWPQEHIQNRAHAVAVFETGDAYEHGSRMVADELAAEGLDMEKSWLTVGDNRVRPEHASNEAEGWIPLDDQFGSGDAEPPTDPGCRCTLLYQVKPV